LAANVNNKGLATIFNMLAGEEARHYKIVSDMKMDIAPDLAETNVLSDAKDVFAKMRESAQSFDLNISEVELYKKALEIEKQSWDFYLEKADEIAEAREEIAQKEIFIELAEEEKKHYFLVENIIDFVSRPQTWLENAEFYHLEEY
jgi:rubrerythrin